MKKIEKTFIVVILFLMTGSLSAQTVEKFGHLDFAELYNSMPGLDSVKIQYEQYAKTIQGQFDAMQGELENKVLDYQTNLETMSAIIKQTKEKEIQDLQARMEAFQYSAQQDMQNKEAELTAPLIEKAEKAVKDVAKEHGYTYVFNTTGGLLLFANPSEDILDLVKAKLGIQ